jgi:heme exporter protein D
MQPVFFWVAVAVYIVVVIFLVAHVDRRYDDLLRQLPV